MRPSKGWISLSLTLGLLAGGLPAEASEVVKLARLVVGGKRAAPAEATRTTPAEQRPANTSPQAQGNTSGGGGEDTGNAPAPARGVS
ncbi:hypothetical protein ACG04Q_07185 [Roseateles sp. DXS20W]|uniref:Uncharacterized protein n=1 Tax=Pelomonas lactea TaxID=3299030 RepID=A0ABW7GHD5_9BURK